MPPPRASRRSLPISVYLFAFMAVALIPALALAYLYLSQAEAIQARAADQSYANAHAELRQIITDEAAEIVESAAHLARWEETVTQFDDPTYYQYWKQTRVRDVWRFQKNLAAVDLFDTGGEPLAREGAIGPNAIEQAIGAPMLLRDGDRTFIVYFHPVSSDSGTKVRGYIGVRANVAVALHRRHALLYSEPDMIEWDLVQGQPLPLATGIAGARIALKSNPEIEAFVNLVRSSFRQYIAYVVLILASIGALLLVLVARPLQRLVKYIKQLNEGKSEQIPEGFQGKVRIAELEQVRDAVNDYRERFRSATEDLMSKNDELMMLTYRDTLTGVYNRRAFELHLQKALHSAHTDNARHALCYLDLDQFKIINDTCGHMAGDELLKQVASTLQAEIREGDMLARLGGDEFGLLLENCALEDAANTAEVLRESLKKFRFAWEDKLFDVGGSIGLVPINSQSGSLTDVLRAADSACYVAKDLGRNRVQIYQADDKDLAQRYGEMQWVTRITKALEEDRFELYCQSIVPISNMQLAPYFEILLRMRDEGGEIIPPMAFLPAAERYNLMPTIDRWVIRSAIAAMRTGVFRMGGKGRAIAINLSGQSLGDEKFLQFVSDMLSRPGIDPELIRFEITETAAVTNFVAATRFMSTLRARGCRFSLDDFGSGLSSFGYLKNLQVDHLKIDGHFVKNLIDDKIGASMVEAINQIGHVMGILTVAEFVENEAILQKLKTIGVDFAQGYGIDRPKPISALGGASDERAAKARG